MRQRSVLEPKPAARKRSCARAVACFDAPPMHIARDSGRERATRQWEDEYRNASAGARLHAHQRVVLDWYLLSRVGANALTSVLRSHLGCRSFGGSGGLGPGHSFFGWARALSGLGFDPPDPVWARCEQFCGPCAQPAPAASRPAGCAPREARTQRSATLLSS